MIPPFPFQSFVFASSFETSAAGKYNINDNNNNSIINHIHNNHNDNNHTVLIIETSAAGKWTLATLGTLSLQATAILMYVW